MSAMSDATVCIRYMLTLVAVCIGPYGKTNACYFAVCAAAAGLLAAESSYAADCADSGHKPQICHLQIILRLFTALIIEKIPFFVFSVISSVITFLVQQSGGAVVDINVLSFEQQNCQCFLIICSIYR